MHHPRIVIPTDVSGEPNRVCLRQAYVDFVVRAGGLPVLAPPVEVIDEEWLAAYKPQGLLLSGGGDLDPAQFGQARHPEAQPLDKRREAAELAWFGWADRQDLPILGICLGCQVINVARGGSLHQYLPELPGTIRHHGQMGEITHDAAVAGPRLREILGPSVAGINSRHQQAVDRLGRGLIVAAQAPDGVVEAVEDPQRRFLIGVQWHPEDLPDHPATVALGRAFIRAAGQCP